MKNRIFFVLFLIIGILFISYDFVIIALCPGSFLSNLISFSHVWLIPGAYFIFLAFWWLIKKTSFWKSLQKKIRILFVIAGSVLGVVCVISLCFICNPKKASIEESADYLILLGGGIDNTGKLPESVLKRVEKAGEYLKLHPETVCVVTGGTLYLLPYAEAPELKHQLVLCGIPEEKILVEDKAKDTIQNLQFSCKMLSESFNKSEKEILESKVLIVTSDFHMRRAQRLAQRLGFENYKGITSKTPPIKILNSYTREICAYAKLNLRILFTGKPVNIVVE